MTERVALYFPSLRTGGVQRFMLTMAQGLVDCGYLVDFVLVKAHGEFMAQVPRGVRVVDLKARGAIASLPALVRYLRREKPALIISAQTHINVIAVIGTKLAGRRSKLVISERTHLSSSVHHSKRLGDRLRPLAARLFYPAADAVIAVSEDVAEDLSARIGLPRQKIQVVNNPYELDAIAVQAAEPVDHPWFNQDEAPVFLAAGRIDSPKDYPTLLRAFAIVRANMPAHLVILGEGPLRQQLTSLVNQMGITKDVSLPGFVPNPYAYVAKASVFVLSSAWEGFPNVLVEALACQTQVVSTNCPSGPSEILDKGRYGRLVPVGNHHALSAAMIEALRKPIPGEMLLARAGEFSLEKSITGYLKAAGFNPCVGKA